MIQTVKTPQGTRDYTPAIMSKRNHIFEVLKKHFRRYGYPEIQTPAMEELSTLCGKYGDEGDKLLFRILNSGAYLNKVDEKALTLGAEKQLTPQIANKGLRYDLTIPFARFVVKHRHELTLPFRRFQIQPVWRADRPQKGRYREFYQCDADIVGSRSLFNETELVSLFHEVFDELGIRTVIKINHRKILAGLVEVSGATEFLVPITIAIDKLDKIGLDKVIVELEKIGLTSTAIEKIKEFLGFQADSHAKLNRLKELLEHSGIGMEGVSEMEELFQLISSTGLPINYEFDLTLARGLNYYTGAIFEVQALDVKMGSIGGGGRYDDLTGVFGMENLSGVGISFGAERIYDIMEELNLFPINFRQSSSTILFINFSQTEATHTLSLLQKLRQQNIHAELYPDSVKMKKQMEYANKKEIPFVGLVGENEIETNTVSVKNMNTGEQKQYSPEELIEFLTIVDSQHRRNS